MTFTVTYRGADGAMREECVEAASRGECFAQCRARGIAPLSVKEGDSASRRGAGARRGETGGTRSFPRRGSGDNGGKDGRAEGKAWKRRATAAAILILAAIVGGGAWWWMRREGGVAPDQPEGPKKTALAKEVKPAQPAEPAPNAATNKPPLTKEEKRAAQLKAIRDKYGDDIPPNLQPVVYFLENPPQREFHPAKSKASIFKRRCEREIASMIMAEPGTWFMRRPTFDARFDADFRASLDEPIEIGDGDTDEQRSLKQAVIDTKAELAERMKAGESPSDAMNAFAGSMYELGQYRRTLQDELGRIKRDASFSDQDIQDFVEAANKMLKDKGAQPIRMPNMVFRHVSLKKAAAKAAEKARKEKENAK